MRTLYEMRSNAASSGTGCTSCSVEELAEVINLLDRRARRFKALCDAQREMIAWYEDDHDIFEYEDEDLPGEVLEYRKALEAIEQEWEEDSEPI